MKIQQFIEEIRENPRDGTGQPEQLKFMENETWSRRVNSKHRFTYEVGENKIILLSAYGHYSDK
ncbi:MAG: Txe/YoeB family addiction module toxin [Candidatus Ornithobacterium hominis]|uniref:Txe/YoeB family addiction module toxin n=1 Tax=Candidatus Ornithobacterium hominis TaxID=2497989 RepID=UPI001FE73137|nr:Txe/YoeB family addiction module toxin [Candidatus Ornithobacterium hominis]MCT7904458.1 Txe/YoeB family addiction module toxin [Candidatus Ornithobacterium hominis]